MTAERELRDRTRVVVGLAGELAVEDLFHVTAFRAFRQVIFFPLLEFECFL